MWDSQERQDYLQSGFPYFEEFPHQFIYWIEVLHDCKDKLCLACRHGEIQRWVYFHSAGDSTSECDANLKDRLPLHKHEKAGGVYRCTYEQAASFANLYDSKVGMFKRSNPNGEIIFP